jgi:hypothetical protein
MGQRVKDMPEGMTLNESTRMGYVNVGISNEIGK